VHKLFILVTNTRATSSICSIVAWILLDGISKRGFTVRGCSADGHALLLHFNNFLMPISIAVLNKVGEKKALAAHDG